MVDIYEEIGKLKKSGNTIVLITIVKKEGSSPVQVGTKMLVLPDGSRIGTVGGGTLEQVATKKANEIFSSKISSTVKYTLSDEDELIDEKNIGMICGGKVTLFYEYIGSNEHLYIIGAGHIGKALLYHIKNLNYFTTIIDTRVKELQNIQGFHKILVSNYKNIFKDEKVPEGSYFIVATHSHEFDYIVLKKIFETDCNAKYIGVVASLTKGKSIIKRLLDEVDKGFDFKILHMPVGLDIGGKTPDEIAISIIAEIQAIQYKKDNVPHLRKDWREYDK